MRFIITYTNRCNGKRVEIVTRLLVKNAIVYAKKQLQYDEISASLTDINGVLIALIERSSFGVFEITTNDNLDQFTLKKAPEIDNDAYKVALKAMQKALDYHSIDYGIDGLGAILNEWATKKAALYQMLRQHPNWSDEALAILTTTSEVTRANPYRAYERYYGFVYAEMRDKALSGIKVYSDAWHDALNAVQRKSDAIGNFVSSLLNTSNRMTTGPEIERLRSYIPEIDLPVGQKATRALQSLAKQLGLDTEKEDFRKMFGQIGDMISEKSREVPFVMSINPADFLTMSVGTTWRSCHNIVDGEYRAGCVDYITDGLTAISYTLDNAPWDKSDLCITGKRTRELFFVSTDGDFVPSRTYPYRDDNGMRESYCETVKQVIAAIKGWDNAGWIIDEYPTRPEKIGPFHYADYQCYTYPWYKPERLVGLPTHGFKIGGPNFCLKCGKERESGDEGAFNCSDCDDTRKRCAHCGASIDNDDVIWIDDEPYCNDCVEQCGECGECHLNGELTEVRAACTTCRSRHYVTRYVCNSCRDKHYTQCTACEQWYEMEEGSTTEDGEFYCPNCAPEHVAVCEECGECHLLGDMVEVNDCWYCEGCQPEAEPDEPEDEPDEAGSNNENIVEVA